jgi:hypothetical protein
MGCISLLRLDGLSFGVGYALLFAGPFYTIHRTLPKDVEVQERQFEVTREFKIIDFARLLAKIAHSYAVAEFGLGAFDSFLPPLILGKSLNLPDFVGGVTSPTPNGSWFLGEHGTKVKSLIEHYLNWEVVRAVDQSTYLTVVIQLLQSYAPKYRVVVARASG